MLARGFGGAERYFVDLSLALAERGHDVLAICQPGSMAAARLQARPRLRLATVRVAGAWDPFAVLGVRRHLAAFRPDVVETHLARAAHVAGRAASPLRLPVTARIHNYVKLKYYRRVDLFWPTTRDQRDYLIRSGIEQERIEVIPHFSALQPVEFVQPIVPGAPIAALGRFVRKKGFDVLLTAAARLRAAGWELQYIIGGDGPERAALLSQAALLGMGGQVSFPGWQDDVAAFLNGAAAFVLPSRDEPFGIVVLEAMARGIPIVATATQGPREILCPESAYLVPIDDPAALATALARALNRPEERRAMAQAALELFRRRYAEDVVVPQVISAYQRLMLCSRK